MNSLAVKKIFGAGEEHQGKIYREIAEEFNLFTTVREKATAEFGHLLTFEEAFAASVHRWQRDAERMRLPRSGAFDAHTIVLEHLWESVRKDLLEEATPEAPAMLVGDEYYAWAKEYIRINYPDMPPGWNIAMQRWLDLAHGTDFPDFAATFGEFALEYLRAAESDLGACSWLENVYCGGNLWFLIDALLPPSVRTESLLRELVEKVYKILNTEGMEPARHFVDGVQVCRLTMEEAQKIYFGAIDRVMEEWRSGVSQGRPTH